MRKTKIVATIGPVTESEEMIRELIKAGADVLRLNTSHENPEVHQRRIETIKKVRKEFDKPIAILLDLAGPKIRTGKFNKDEVTLQEGQEFILTTEDVIGDETKVSINYKGLPKDVKPGDLILVNDGKLKLEVIESDDLNIKTRVINTSTITHRRGINAPGADIKIPALTEKDKKYIEFGIENEVDYFALSFVRKPEDVIEMREILKSLNALDAQIISKIETKQAIDNDLEKIIELSDGVMVARGDLGVEVEAEKIPVLQKKIISIANKKSKPVITATQMLETMIENPVPTRAETTDIANAILDGTDAVMLSGETSIGKYPLEVVKVMDRVARETEPYLNHYGAWYFDFDDDDSTTNAISKAANEIAISAGIKTIVAVTDKGDTARAVSRYRENVNIIAVTHSEKTYNRLALVWGVKPMIVNEFVSTDTMLYIVKQTLKNEGLVQSGEKIIFTAGIPYGFSSKTNFLHIAEIK
ncbi:pyruvate kinase [Marinitoga hydrogenitolerans DSM 16785]|uniref:Pyruvate kinase n=1 Tax=Marinitoga hydrogenitolerans (strain DSM 16785 / JCM 12826 / AT1271) TaxID=1122195 RepID=A0A1M4VEF3_MARH1|nr:pyruvate kinase [Marinitoga hydrogenitolerans]SHE67366.1 pyruvate kinase [Marinitoga hydrogenitolerans DSM 16785]